MLRYISILSLSCSSLIAITSDPQVIHGQANVSSCAEGVEIIAQDRTVLEWPNFSIHENEFARFILPSSDSAILNRIVGNEKSLICGKLESNGQIILMNQAGVIFGNNCTVNVGTLVVSCIDILNHPFTQNRELCFVGNEGGSISIQGELKIAGDFYAIAHSLEVDGSISVNEGDASFIAIGNIFLDPDSHASIYERSKAQGVKVSLRGLQKDLELGSLLFKGSVNCSATKSDRNALFATAAEIGVDNGAVLSVSNSGGGGEIYLGGSSQGLPQIFPTATSVIMSPTSVLDVSAKERGNGGRAIIWSDHNTEFHGTIRAGGGALSGNGGFIDISGRGDLIFNGSICTDAPFGNPGELLIDPTNVLIAAANNNIAPVPPLPPPYTFTGPAVSINAANLATVLAGTNVTINTSGPNNQGQPGNIQITSTLSWNSARTLTLIADQDIIVGATVENLGAGAITFTATRDITLDALNFVANVVVGARNGAVNITAGRDILLQGGPAGGGLARFATIGTAAAAANTGTITVTAGRNATLRGGTGAIAGAGNAASALIGGFTTSTRVINLTVGNDLTILGGTGGLENNGAPVAIVGSYQGTNSGNINVKVGRNCLIQGGNALALVNRVPCAGICRAGEGTTFPASNSVTDFNVDVGNNLTIIGGTSASPNAACSGLIGWGGFQFLGGPGVTAPANTGNININVGHNLEMATGVGLGSASIVGGTQRPCQGNVTINVGEYMWLHHQNPAQVGSLTGCLIGGSGQRTQWLLNFFVTVGRTLTMDARNGAFVSFHCFNTGGNYVNQGIVQFHIGGDLVFLGGNDPVSSDLAAVWLHPNMVNEIWVGGNWRAYNGTPIGTENYAGVEPNTFFAGGNIGRPDWRTGGNMIVAGALNAQTASLFTTTQSMTAIADYTFAPGQLWAPKSAIVNGINIFTGTPLGAISTNTSTVSPFHSGGDGLGAFAVDTTSYNLSPFAFPTTITGPTWSISTPVPPAPGTPNNTFTKFYSVGITSAANMLISSSDFFDNATPADFAIGTVPQTVRLRDSFGNITVQGFRDVNITNVNSILANAGNISISVTRDINGNNSTSTAGNTIQLTAGRNINLTTASMNAGVDLNQTAADDIILLNSSETATAGNIISLAGNNSVLSNSSASAGFDIDWVIDNDFAVRPLIGPSSFSMDATSFFNAGLGYIRVYTARQGQNTISPLAQFISNGVPSFFTPGALFVDTNQEQWCTYYPEGTLGIPFRIFYKDCIQLIAQQATEIVDQFLVDLHPYNQFPGWMERYWIGYKSTDSVLAENPIVDKTPYYLRRRHLNVINHPKSYTHLNMFLNE